MKTVKFTPQLTDLIRKGQKTTTFRLFDDKDLTIGDEIVLATRDGDKVTEFGKAVITEVIFRTVSTLQPEDYLGHEPIINNDPLEQYKVYYGEKVTKNTEVKVIRFKVLSFYQ